jgi:hypothetical protein
MVLFFRVHHFARKLASPFPLLAAVGAKTHRIEIGTAVIDMRYENPLYMAEDAGAADLIAGGRLQLGIRLGSPEQVIDGWRYFGYRPVDGKVTPIWAGAMRRSLLTCLAAEVLRNHPLGVADGGKRPGYNNPVVAGRNAGNPVIVAFHKCACHSTLGYRGPG